MEHDNFTKAFTAVADVDQYIEDNKLEQQFTVETAEEPAATKAAPVEPTISETKNPASDTLGRNGKMVYNFIKAITDRRLLATDQDDTKTAAAKELAGLIGLFLTGLSWGVAIHRYSTSQDSVWVSVGAMLLPQLYLPVISGVMTAEWLFRA